MEINSKAVALVHGKGRYFTGKPCKHGHVEERITSSRKCTGCNRAYQSKRYKNDKKYRETARARLIAATILFRESGQKRKIDPAQRNKWNRTYYRKNPFGQVLRVMLRRVLAGKERQGSPQYILGYTTEQLKDRLMVQFEPGMSFSNYGEWHIDHKKPVSAFVAKNPRTVNMLCNLQPIWAKDNIAKGAKW